MPEPIASPPSDDAAPICHCQSLRQAARRATALYDAMMAPFGLRISQFAILVRLDRQGPTGLRALAAALGLDRTTLGRNLRPLERDGLIASDLDGSDRRVRHLVLTAAGRAVVARAMPAWRAAQDGYEAQVGMAEARRLRDELQRLSRTLDVPDRAAAR